MGRRLKHKQKTRLALSNSVKTLRLDSRTSTIFGNSYGRDCGGLARQLNGHFGDTSIINKQRVVFVRDFVYDFTVEYVVEIAFLLKIKRCK